MLHTKQEANTLDNVKIKYVTADFDEEMSAIKDFITLDPESLDSTNRELLSAVKCLYKLNQRETPLYKSFPDRPDTPLIINGTDLLKWSVVPNEGEELAFFIPRKNEVTFNNKEKGVELLVALSHELKHAEQYSQEFEEMQKEDGLAHHQLSYLQEAQAFAFSDYVLFLFLLDRAWNFDRFPGGTPNDQVLFEQERIRLFLPRLFESSYRDEYHKRRSIKDDDKGISHIPESFNLKDRAFEEEMLKQLGNVPRKAKEPASRLLQLLSDNHEIEAIWFLVSKFKGLKRIPNLALALLIERARFGHIKREEFENLVRALSSWGVTMPKDSKIREKILRTAAGSKDIFDVLVKEGIFSKEDIPRVIDIAFRERNFQVIESVFKFKNENSNLTENQVSLEPVSSKELFQPIKPIWVASQDKVSLKPCDLEKEKTK